MERQEKSDQGENAPFARYVRCGQKRLRCGYTTGTCAALAATGAVRLLLEGRMPEILSIRTPKGWIVTVKPVYNTLEKGIARCAVRKDAGDDPDVTDGCLIVAEARKTDRGFSLDGGAGVGRVTKPGLDQPVGAAAINRVPRRMIAAAAEEVCAAAGYTGGLSIIISVPDGEKLAAKTFNPQLGIVGGISILGTSGIVEPMSEQALLDAVAVEIHQAAICQSEQEQESGQERGKTSPVSKNPIRSGVGRLILTPGNYGMEFLKKNGWDAAGGPIGRFSNSTGEALDMAAAEGFRSVLIAGHIGKLVKLAGGIMNSHSRQADCRSELFCAHAAICGADTALCRALMNAATTDACIALLDDAGMRVPVLESLFSAMQKHLDRRAAGAFSVGAAAFSNVYGYLGRTPAAGTILSKWFPSPVHIRSFTPQPPYGGSPPFKGGQNGRQNAKPPVTDIQSPPF